MLVVYTVFFACRNSPLYILATIGNFFRTRDGMVSASPRITMKNSDDKEEQSKHLIMLDIIIGLAV